MQRVSNGHQRRYFAENRILFLIKDRKSVIPFKSGLTVIYRSK